jgi:hypothetical protein
MTLMEMWLEKRELSAIVTTYPTLGQYIDGQVLPRKMKSSSVTKMAIAPTDQPSKAGV